MTAVDSCNVVLTAANNNFLIVRATVPAGQAAYPFRSGASITTVGDSCTSKVLIMTITRRPNHGAQCSRSSTTSAVRGQRTRPDIAAHRKLAHGRPPIARSSTGRASKRLCSTRSSRTWPGASSVRYASANGWTGWARASSMNRARKPSSRR